MTTSLALRMKFMLLFVGTTSQLPRVNEIFITMKNIFIIILDYHHLSLSRLVPSGPRRTMSHNINKAGKTKDSHFFLALEHHRTSWVLCAVLCVCRFRAKNGDSSTQQPDHHRTKQPNKASIKEFFNCRRLLSTDHKYLMKSTHARSRV